MYTTSRLRVRGPRPEDHSALSQFLGLSAAAAAGGTPKGNALRGSSIDANPGVPSTMSQDTVLPIIPRPPIFVAH